MTALDALIDDLFMIGFGLNNRPVRSSGFPFYNVIKTNEDSFTVELALAGFNEKDIEIQEHNSTLVIKGTLNSEKQKEYLWRGITTKPFIRTFPLAEHVHVETASMKDGILSISLKRDIPEAEKPKLISIETR